VPNARPIRCVNGSFFRTHYIPESLLASHSYCKSGHLSATDKTQRGLRPGNPNPEKQRRSTNKHESTLMKAIGLVFCPSGSVISVY
jgi:hypothetical protein